MRRETTIGSLCDSVGLNDTQANRLREHSRTYLIRHADVLTSVPDETLIQLATDFLSKHGSEHFPSGGTSEFKWSDISCRSLITTVVTDIMILQRRHAVETLHRKGPCSGCVFHSGLRAAQTPMQDGSSSSTNNTHPPSSRLESPFTSFINESVWYGPNKSNSPTSHAQPRKRTRAAIAQDEFACSDSEKLAAEPVTLRQEYDGNEHVSKRKRHSSDSPLAEQYISDQEGTPETISVAMYAYRSTWIGFKSPEDKMAALEHMLNIVYSNLEKVRLRAYTHHLKLEEKQKISAISGLEKQVHAELLAYLKTVGRTLD